MKVKLSERTLVVIMLRNLYLETGCLYTYTSSIDSLVKSIPTHLQQYMYFKDSGDGQSMQTNARQVKKLRDAVVEVSEDLAWDKTPAYKVLKQRLKGAKSTKRITELLKGTFIEDHIPGQLFNAPTNTPQHNLDMFEKVANAMYDYHKRNCPLYDIWSKYGVSFKVPQISTNTPPDLLREIDNIVFPNGGPLEGSLVMYLPKSYFDEGLIKKHTDKYVDPDIDYVSDIAIEGCYTFSEQLEHFQTGLMRDVFKAMLKTSGVWSIQTSTIYQDIYNVYSVYGYLRYNVLIDATPLPDGDLKIVDEKVNLHKLDILIKLVADKLNVNLPVGFQLKIREVQLVSDLENLLDEWRLLPGFPMPIFRGYTSEGGRFRTYQNEIVSYISDMGSRFGVFVNKEYLLEGIVDLLESIIKDAQDGSGALIEIPSPHAVDKRALLIHQQIFSLFNYYSLDELGYIALLKLGVPRFLLSNACIAALDEYSDIGWLPSIDFYCSDALESKLKLIDPDLTIDGGSAGIATKRPEAMISFDTLPPPTFNVSQAGFSGEVVPMTILGDGSQHTETKPRLKPIRETTLVQQYIDICVKYGTTPVERCTQLLVALDTVKNNLHYGAVIGIYNSIIVANDKNIGPYIVGYNNP